jgi:hypothetical protein
MGVASNLALLQVEDVVLPNAWLAGSEHYVDEQVPVRLHQPAFVVEWRRCMADPAYVHTLSCYVQTREATKRRKQEEAAELRATQA